MSPTQMRRIILRQSKRANVGHIGSCLSVVEILSALYGEVLRIPDPDDPALNIKGWVTGEQMDTFCGDDSMLGVHPESVLPGVDFSTGSLGQGPCVAAGAALAARLQGSSRRIFCLISDGECNEGSVWEAAMFAAHGPEYARRRF
jgi:transketolase